ncbi:MAG: PqqD family protein [Planctomycetota bacterium]
MPPLTYRRREDLPFQKIEEQILVVDAPDRQVHLLPETAARIWELLAEEITLDAITRSLVDEYDVTPERAAGETAEFLAELGRKNMLQGNPGIP